MTPNPENAVIALCGRGIFALVPHYFTFIPKNIFLRKSMLYCKKMKGGLKDA